MPKRAHSLPRAIRLRVCHYNSEGYLRTERIYVLSNLMSVDRPEWAALCLVLDTLPERLNQADMYHLKAAINCEYNGFLDTYDLDLLFEAEVDREMTVHFHP